jgi:hypothetical protein
MPQRLTRAAASLNVSRANGGGWRGSERHPCRSSSGRRWDMSQRSGGLEPSRRMGALRSQSRALGADAADSRLSWPSAAGCYSCCRSPGPLSPLGCVRKWTRPSSRRLSSSLSRSTQSPQGSDNAPGHWPGTTRRLRQWLPTGSRPKSRSRLATARRSRDPRRISAMACSACRSAPTSRPDVRSRRCSIAAPNAGRWRRTGQGPRACRPSCTLRRSRS